MSGTDGTATDSAPAGKRDRAGDSGGAVHRLFRDPMALVCLSLLALFVVCAIVGVTLASGPAFAVSVADSFQPPSAAHLMGTDAEGRDVFARVLYGSAISLFASLSIMTVSAVIGSSLGLVAGFARGAVDTIILRALDSLLAFPTIVLAICVSIGLGSGLGSAILGIAFSCVPYYGRLLRSDVVRITAEPFVESARALGASRRWIVVRHVLPHTLPTLLVQSASVLGAGALMLAALSFVGLGVAAPTPEWGAMITAGMEVWLTGQWWVAFFPGIALILFAANAHILADRVRSATGIGDRR